MALTHCTHCGQSVAINARACPHCGAQEPLTPLPTPPDPNRAGITSMLVFIGLLLMCVLIGKEVVKRIQARSATPPTATTPLTPAHNHRANTHAVGVGLHLGAHSLTLEAASPKAPPSIVLQPISADCLSEIVCAARYYHTQAKTLCLQALREQHVKHPVYQTAGTLFQGFSWANAQKTAITYRFNPMLFTEASGAVRATDARCQFTLPQP